MSLFTPEQWQQLQERLVSERETVTKRMAERRKGLKGLTVARPDDADWASDSVDQSLLARLVDRDANLLQEIGRAIAKMTAGTYGLCEATGEPIDIERLLARPWSRLGVAAKEHVERAKAAASNDNGVEPLTTSAVQDLQEDLAEAVGLLN